MPHPIDPIVEIVTDCHDMCLQTASNCLDKAAHAQNGAYHLEFGRSQRSRAAMIGCAPHLSGGIAAWIGFTFS